MLKSLLKGLLLLLSSYPQHGTSTCNNGVNIDLWACLLIIINYFKSRRVFFCILYLNIQSATFPVERNNKFYVFEKQVENHKCTNIVFALYTNSWLRY